jgi:hypothetical protein
VKTINNNQKLSNSRLSNARKGFNLAEIVVATAVIALMMVSLIGYVQSAGTLWQKSHATIGLVNEGNALLDYIEREIWIAKDITTPGICATTSQLIYSKEISDYQASPATCTIDFVINTDFTQGIATTSLLLTTSKWTDPTTGADALGWSVDSALNTKEIISARYNFTLCSNLQEMHFYRKSNRLMVVTFKLSIPRVDDDYERVIEFKRMMIMR